MSSFQQHELTPLSKNCSNSSSPTDNVLHNSTGVSSSPLDNSIPNHFSNFKQYNTLSQPQSESNTTITPPISPQHLSPHSQIYNTCSKRKDVHKQKQEALTFSWKLSQNKSSSHINKKHSSAFSRVSSPPNTKNFLSRDSSDFPFEDQNIAQKNMNKNMFSPSHNSYLNERYSSWNSPHNENPAIKNPQNTLIHSRNNSPSSSINTSKPNSLFDFDIIQKMCSKIRNFHQQFCHQIFHQWTRQVKILDLQCSITPKEHQFIEIVFHFYDENGNSDPTEAAQVYDAFKHEPFMSFPTHSPSIVNGPETRYLRELKIIFDLFCDVQVTFENLLKFIQEQENYIKSILINDDKFKMEDDRQSRLLANYFFLSCSINFLAIFVKIHAHMVQFKQ
eukprot:gb/GECH01011410.1/.p1 GENE.gb/GECH01011410.1/~~gb/GECH01011410.1/.p1  ORF type:complete len:390 (+),score=92.52 gb/GECH01011410.1/:1-1170(+)